MNISLTGTPSKSRRIEAFFLEKVHFFVSEGGQRNALAMVPYRHIQLIGSVPVRQSRFLE